MSKLVVLRFKVCDFKCVLNFCSWCVSHTKDSQWRHVKRPSLCSCSSVSWYRESLCTCRRC
jgi:hypothetical protein